MTSVVLLPLVLCPTAQDGEGESGKTDEVQMQLTHELWIQRRERSVGAQTGGLTRIKLWQLKKTLPLPAHLTFLPETGAGAEGNNH